MADSNPSKKKKVALNIQIDEEDHRYLTEQAEMKGISAAGLVRMIIKEHKKENSSEGK